MPDMGGKEPPEEERKEMAKNMRPHSRMNEWPGLATWVKVVLALAAIFAVVLLALFVFNGKAHADPDTNDSDGTNSEVCGAFNLGVPPGEIIDRLGRNDARNNYWKAQRDTVWPIIEGDCG